LVGAVLTTADAGIAKRVEIRVASMNAAKIRV
jgi:hypothetical protein